MKKVTFNSSSLWNSVLLFSAIFAAFAVPVLPVHLHRIAFSVAYTAIYISAVFSLENRSKTVVTLFITTIIMQWISALLNLELLNDVSKAFNVIFFLVVVFSLIRQIAQAKEVSAGVILGFTYRLLINWNCLFSFCFLHHQNCSGSLHHSNGRNCTRGAC
jgi:hypothetical protein